MKLVRALSLLMIPAHFVILLIALFTLSNGGMAWAITGLTFATFGYVISLPEFQQKPEQHWHPEL